MHTLFLLLASVSFADVVGPDATGCPRGSHGTSNHRGSYCTPSPECTDTCENGDPCDSVGLCILEEERSCGGMTDPKNPCTYTHMEALGRCSDQSDCATGTCVVTERCVSNAGCGCTTGAPASGLALFGLLPLVLLRRRR